MKQRKFSLWREKIFKLTHALILPLSILVIASLLLNLSNILQASNINNHFTLLLKVIGSVIFDNLPLIFSIVIVLYFTKINKLYAILMLIFSLLIFYSTQSVFIQKNKFNVIENIFYIHNGQNLKYLIKNNLGIESLETSFLGPFTCSAAVIFIINRYSNFMLPKFLSLFSNERLVPFILLPVIVVISLIFLTLWPYLAYGLTNLMIASTKLKYGFDAFSYGLVTRLLKPFGFHYIFTHLILETEIGGRITSESIENLLKIPNLDPKVFESINNLLKNFFNYSQKIGYLDLVGDREIWDFINTLKFDKMPTVEGENVLNIFPWFDKYLNFYVGRFSQDYAIYLGMSFGLTSAIIFSAPKEQKKQLTLIVLPALLIAFLNGITEPLEFILLFSLPSLYFFFYVPLSGFSLMFMKIFNVHIGGNFIRGFVDFITYGIIPHAKGTKFWVVFPLAFIEAWLTFLAFYFAIKKHRSKRLIHSDYNILYLNKIRFENLLNLGYKKSTNVKQQDSLKAQINDYLLNNLKNGKWKFGDKLPSEEGLAVQFHCSRLTARSALLKLVESGVLFSIKGQGYYLTNYGVNHLLNPNHQTLNYHNQIIKQIKAQDFYFNPKWFKELGHDFASLKIHKTHNFEKKYFDKSDNLILYEISILNKEQVFLDESLYTNQSFLQYLTLQGLKLTNHSSQVVLTNNEKYRFMARTMGYKYEYPVIVSVLCSKDKWVEISLQIMPRASFNFSRDYKIIT